MPEASGDTSLTMESAQQRIDSLLSAPAETEKPADAPPAKEAATATSDAEPTPDATEGDEGTEAESATETQPDDEPRPEPRKVKVKVDGQDLEVTEDELIKGYSRQADYTKKTTQLAEERKAAQAALEGEVGKVRTQSQEYESRLTAVHDALKALTPEEPNWTERRAAVGEEQANAEFRAFREQHDRLTKIAAERDRVKAENDAALSAEADKHLDAERGKLREAVPEWKEPEKFKAGITELRAYAKDKLGFTDAELNTVVDSRLLLVLRKAQQFDAGAAAKPKVQQKIDDAMVTTAPGATVDSKPKSELAKAKATLAKSGRIDDAAAAIAHLL